MRDMIKKILSQIFPMSARNMQVYFLKLNDDLNALHQAQERILKDMYFTKELCRNVSKSVHNVQSENAVLRLKLEQMQQTMSVLQENIDKLRFNYRENMQQYDAIHTEINNLDQIMQRSENGINEIQTGDIFRRIEFLQGKIICLEQMIQRYHLTQQDQQNNRTYEFIDHMRKLFQRKGVVGFPFVRIGRETDGGYVMVDDFEARTIAYSIGICDDVSWDTDMASRQLDIFMYDHTIDDIPEKNPRFHFFKVGLAAETRTHENNLMSLQDMLRNNGHEQESGMILKIDIEGAEWDVLTQIDSACLEQFSQIVFEFHGLTLQKDEAKMCNALMKLNETHQLVHIHANNYGSYLQIGGAVMPELIEATYVLKSEYKFEDQCELLPLREDRINCAYLPDIFLGEWNT